MAESILQSTKKALGLQSDYDVFDQELIMFINSIFNVLTQVGVGPVDGFAIEDESAEWEDFTDDETTLNMVKTYMHIRVKLIFDPPQTSFVIASLENIQKELEWRLNVTSDELYQPIEP